MTLLDWPMAILIMFVIFVVAVALSTGKRQRHELSMAEIKARAQQDYGALAERYEALARETRDAEAAMQADLAAVRVSVEAIEAMMRDVS
jgi:hypothetical protein